MRPAARVSALIAAVAVRGAIAGLSLAPMRSKIADLQARIAALGAAMQACISAGRGVVEGERVGTELPHFSLTPQILGDKN